MTDRRKDTEEAASLRMGGYVLVTVGAIILPLCGLCTGAFLSGGGWRYPSALVLALIFGGLPMAGAVFALWRGIAIVRKNPKTPRPPGESEP